MTRRMYLERAEQALTDEQARAGAYIDESTVEKLSQTCRQELMGRDKETVTEDDHSRTALPQILPRPCAHLTATTAESTRTTARTATQKKNEARDNKWWIPNFK
uniref:Uncharacterized protein n=1 Tax=Chromera velia CCMP2878 TaxID=1169474 RepID=A0A0G4HJX9_9ALVE|mmetsp:Transcript_55571/g.108835  ORF Transcript_55571/g.108835 Transcript_55571/m.108835 type:complete len:104 (+) Transcript_55571:1435-1746(+)|eukprot:Cvel_7202.t1-p1 / transcript=Cvel_7202.t1 / gene=Cvel_7202 / organism=Chromera_velia_CCMP2878 / gene_product=hypothetical protein / transcript_product=hypothetical protein / location=Cvel_scaffold371:12771-13661(-) / protein_length=103 / sequence_SO=supercontig / SO=protein_coding / is_pseudo=false